MVEQKLNYIHQNPVRGKWQLVDDFIRYGHCSAGFFILCRVATSIWRVTLMGRKAGFCNGIFIWCEGRIDRKTQHYNLLNLKMAIFNLVLYLIQQKQKLSGKAKTPMAFKLQQVWMPITGKQ